MFYVGCVENRMDPLRLGRCQVRIVGLHTPDKTVLPTLDLPWAYPMGPITSASISGLGWSPTGVVQGTWVIVIFLDVDQQQPIMIGTIGGIPQTKTAALISDSTDSVVTTGGAGELTNSNGDDITDMVDNIIASETPSETSVQSTGTKYELTAVTTDGVTSYNILSKSNITPIATATYDETTELYSVILKRPENFTKEQYLPFTDVNPKTFATTDQITTYFDKNF